VLPFAGHETHSSIALPASVEANARSALWKVLMYFVLLEVGRHVTSAERLYLFCTCSTAFCRFSPIEPIAFSKSFENSPIGADRLPPPPPSLVPRVDAT
jgi:hypothetical protein